MRLDDVLEIVFAGKLDKIIQAAPQEWFGQLLLPVAGDQDQRQVIFVLGAGFFKGIENPVRVVLIGLFDFKLSRSSASKRSLGKSISALSISSISTTDGISFCASRIASPSGPRFRHTRFSV